MKFASKQFVWIFTLHWRFFWPSNTVSIELLERLNKFLPLLGILIVYGNTTRPGCRKPSMLPILIQQSTQIEVAINLINHRVSCKFIPISDFIFLSSDKVELFCSGYAYCTASCTFKQVVLLNSLDFQGTTS